MAVALIGNILRYKDSWTFLDMLAWHLVDNDSPVWGGGVTLYRVWGSTRIRVGEARLMLDA